MFGFLATYFDKIYLWYLFTLFNTLQGVFIFISFGCKRQILKKLKSRLAKLFLLDQMNLNKNSSLTTNITSRDTPTNQSTITHLNSSNKISSNDHLNDFKAKENLFNRLNERSLSKSFGDLYTKNTGSMEFYSSDSLDKSQFNHSINHSINHQINNQINHQINQPISHPISHSINHPINHSINHQTNHPINQPENYQIYNRQIPNNNSPSTFSSNINQDNQTSSSFKSFPYNQSMNSQINRWFDW